MKFRRKPAVIEAVQWNGENIKEILEFADSSFIDKDSYTLKIKTLEGTWTAERGDWIMKDINDEFYPCKPDIFDETYETLGYASGTSDFTELMKMGILGNAEGELTYFPEGSKITLK